MNDRNDYKVRGKRTNLLKIKEEMRARRIPCWHSHLGGWLRIEINNGAELQILQDACYNFDCRYELF